MINIIKLTALLAIIFSSRIVLAQSYSDDRINSMQLQCHMGDFKVSENGDSLFARYLDMNFRISPTGNNFKVEVLNITNPSDSISYGIQNVIIPSENATKSSEVFSVSRNGNEVSVFLGYYALSSRYRIHVWINNQQNSSFTSDF
jgi:hypothetical protein